LTQYARFECDNPSLGIVVSVRGQLRGPSNNRDKWCTYEDRVTRSEVVAAYSLHNSVTRGYDEPKSMHQIQLAIGENDVHRLAA
jgi:hypothetical protein